MKNNIYFRLKGFNMGKRSLTNAEGSIACLGIIFLWIILVLFGGLMWQFSINHWLLWCGKPQTFEFWHGCLISILPPLAGLSVPCAVVTFIVSFFI